MAVVQFLVSWLLPRKQVYMPYCSSLRLFVPNNLQAYYHFSFSMGCAFEVSSSVLEGTNTSICPVTLPVAQLKTRLFTYQSPASRLFQRSCRISPPSSNVATHLRYCPLCHCCIPGASIASSWASILHGLFLRHCPCLVPDDHVPCTVQNDMASKPSMGDSQLLPGPIILGPFVSADHSAL
jgi:hypothetical protein